METAWAHVEHWMWPLFTDRWEAFRERLGLPPCPLGTHEDGAGEAARVTQTQPSGVLSARAGQGNSGALDAVSLRALDPSQLPLVLYLFSPLVVDKSPFWPECVRVCGYLFPTAQAKGGLGAARKSRTPAQAPSEQRQRLHPSISVTPSSAPTSDKAENNGGVYVNDDIDADDTERDCPSKGPLPLSSLPADVEAFLSAQEGRRPVYVGFGSMWGMCVPGYRLAFALRVLLLGAKQAGCRCIVNLPRREGEAAGWRKAGVGEFEDGSGARGGGQGGDGNETRLKELDSAKEWVLGEFATSAAKDDLLVSTTARGG